MIYLGENEMGCDASSIGFPSIDNCRAIVMVTGGGLIGFHLFGTLEKKKANFVTYFEGQPHSVDKRTLYIVTKMSVQVKANFLEEARSIATALNFAGPVYLADVTSYGTRGVLVVFDNVSNHTCIVTARAWDDGVDGHKDNKVPYVGTGRGMAIGNARPTMFSQADETGLKAVYPTTLNP
jgi:hypothetical protein